MSAIKAWAPKCPKCGGIEWADYYRGTEVTHKICAHWHCNHMERIGDWNIPRTELPKDAQPAATEGAKRAAGPCKCGLREIPEWVDKVSWYWQLHGRTECTLELPNKRCWCGLLRSEHIEGHAQPAEGQNAVPPFANCRFKICDLPGQCIGEGKCHHPVPAAPADEAREDCRELLKLAVVVLDDAGSNYNTGTEDDADFDRRRISLLERIDAHLAAQPVAADGFVMVPTKPTPEMLLAGWKANDGAGEIEARIYRAMLTARPKRAEGEE